MGCHESSYFQSEPNIEIKQELPSHPNMKEKDKPDDSLLYAQDSHCINILQYIQSIKDEDWKLVLEEKRLQIFQMKGSIFSEVAMTSKIQLSVRGRIQPKVIFRELNIPELRLKWDRNLEDLTIKKGEVRRSYVSYRRLKLYEESRDFYEKKIIGWVNGVPTCVAYSVDGKHEIPGVNRGHTFMSLVRVGTYRNRTIIEFITQSDYTSSRTEHSIALKITEWCSAFRNALKKYDFS